MDILIIVAMSIFLLVMIAGLLTLFSMARYLQSLITLHENTTHQQGEWFEEIISVLHMTSDEKKKASNVYRDMEAAIDKLTGDKPEEDDGIEESEG